VDAESSKYFVAQSVFDTHEKSAEVSGTSATSISQPKQEQPLNEPTESTHCHGETLSKNDHSLFLFLEILSVDEYFRLNAEFLQLSRYELCPVCKASGILIIVQNLIALPHDMFNQDSFCNLQVQLHASTSCVANEMILII
jgi:hypothetical protein